MIACIVFILFTLFNLLSLYSILIFRQSNNGGLLGYLIILIMLLIEIIGGICLFSRKIRILQIKNLRIVLLWTIYANLVTIIIHINLFTEIRCILWWPMAYCVFYWISIRYNINRHINFFVPLIFIITVVIYYLIRINTVYNIESLYDSKFVDNSVFYLVLLLPLVSLLPLKLKYICFIVSIIAVAFSFKRSAMIASGLMIGICVYIDCLNLLKNKLLKILLPIFILAIISYYVIYLNDIFEGELFVRFEQLSDDGGSGRMDIFSKVLLIIEHRTFDKNIIGEGCDAVIKYIGYSAHNDFLEMFFDYGIFGLIIYLLFFVRMVSSTIKSRKLGNNFFQANIASIIVFIVMSMVSHLWLYPTYFAYIIALWAITNAKLDRRIKNLVDDECAICGEVFPREVAKDYQG